MNLFRDRTAVWVVLLFQSGWALAESAEISVLAGGMDSPDSVQRSYTWQFEYRAEFARDFAWSLAWINEGHVTGHHRDGVAVQAWRNWRAPNDRWVASVGLGAYQFFDTQARAPGNSRIEHGVAPVVSASLTHYNSSRWFWRLSANVIRPNDGIAVNTLALGAGYVLGGNASSGNGRLWANQRYGLEWTTGTELTVFGGKTVVNANSGRRAFATSIEYRRGFARHWDWTLSWLHEGDPELTERDGAAAQVWLVDAFLNERLTFGFGAGLYYYSDGIRSEHTGDTRRTLGGLLSPTISYRVSRHWQARFIWHRVICHYHRDADVFLFGLGRRW